MSERTEEQRKDESLDTSTSDDPVTAARIDEVLLTRKSRGKGRKGAVVAGVVVVVLAVAAGLLWYFLGTKKSGAGRPVPVPRATAGDQPATAGTSPTIAEATITLAPEVVARAGIKVEQVGEQLGTTAEGAGPVSTGVVQANTYRSTPVVSLVGGNLRKVNAEQGQTVRRGQTVAVVTSDELAMTQSRYLAALAELDEHHKHHRRVTSLVEIGAVSREEMEQAVTKLRTAESDVASLRQRLLLLGLTSQRIGALKSSSQISSEVSLPAPITGTVITRSANPGEVIEANKVILLVADLSSVWVVAQVYEKDLGKIRVGSGASITTEAYQGKVFRGSISYIDPSLDQATRTAQVRIELANPGQILKIGMYVNVAFATVGGAENTVPVVPVSAVQNVNNQQVVFVATNDPNVFVMRPVRLGPESQGRYPVLEGVTIGDRIVSEGGFLLRAEWLKLHPAGS